MLDFGVQERWPPKHCARKWQKLNPTSQGSSTPQPQPQSQPTPALSHAQYSDTPEVPNQYGFIPMV